MQAGQNAFDVNDWYGVPVIMPDGSGGFVHKHYEISVNGYGNFEWAPGTDAANANASYYWEKASYGDSDPNTTIRSASSGWFIDKIEGFRRSKSAWKNYAKIKPNHPDFNFSGYRTEHEDVNKNYPYIYAAGAYASVPGYAGIVNGVEWNVFGLKRCLRWGEFGALVRRGSLSVASFNNHICNLFIAHRRYSPAPF